MTKTTTPTKADTALAHVAAQQKLFLTAIASDLSEDQAVRVSEIDSGTLIRWLQGDIWFARSYLNVCSTRLRALAGLSIITLRQILEGDHAFREKLQAARFVLEGIGLVQRGPSTQVNIQQNIAGKQLDDALSEASLGDLIQSAYQLAQSVGAHGAGTPGKAGDPAWGSSAAQDGVEMGVLQPAPDPGEVPPGPDPAPSAHRSQPSGEDDGGRNGSDLDGAGETPLP